MLKIAVVVTFLIAPLSQASDCEFMKSGSPSVSKPGYSCSLVGSQPTFGNHMEYSFSCCPQEMGFQRRPETNQPQYSTYTIESITPGHQKPCYEYDPADRPERCE